MDGIDENTELNIVNERQVNRNYVVMRDKGKTEVKKKDLEFEDH